MRLLTIIAIAVFWLAPNLYAQTAPADVRLVVDISGSMKQTDPGNLRRPALELLVKLLPEQSRAGVWTFGREVNMLVPLESVDESWQQQALERTGDINSVGLFTNIGDALEKATAVPPGAGNASVVLLTDGKVDIDKNATRNARERERILSQLLPEIEARGFRVHTIALSEDADAELLQQLSQTTDGRYSVADSADELMQSFLQIFDQAVPADRLPLKDNRFLVDSSVDEFTALIFRGPDADPTRLSTPSGKTLSPIEHGENTNWYGADSYDLITIRNPEPGQWQVLADAAPQNRVTVVSDLKLKVEPLPNNLVAGRSLEVSFGLYEQGELISDPDFLNLLTASANIDRAGSPAQWQVQMLEDTGSATTGAFTETLPAFEQRGDYQITLTVDGKTFERAFTHRLKVGSLFDVAMDKRIDGKRVIYTVKVSADPKLIDTEQSAVVAHIKKSSGGSALESLTQTQIGQWQLEVVPDTHARYVIQLRASGEDARGENFDENLPSQYFDYPAEGDPVDTPADREIEQLEAELAAEREALARELETESESSAAEPETEPESESVVAEPAQQTPDQPEPEELEKAEEDGTDWLMIAAIALGNLALVGLIYWGYRRFSTQDVQSELDEFEQQLSAKTEPTATEQKPAGDKASDDKTADAMAALDALNDLEDDGSMFPVDGDGQSSESEDSDPPMDDLEEKPADNSDDNEDKK